ncbi:biliverdin-producing heme oxygenase [Gluconobacter cerevisiae]|uniref:Biliverdin-producing heme oxygenase n=1 Tax=Gluconobacter cerevisiae TaxID=1379734 RepID=A0ABR9YD39_9PROT|nr:biliverdin-producing heme oxygenase [Gluconobacter cerevisiae]MBF0876491.1 biliverdin-producing heme oxygenase [Gluconobacter cerevisiae]
MDTVERIGSQNGSGLADLRRVSRQAHETVDEAFSRFDLADRESYGAFLTAHAGALLTAEAYLARHADAVPAWRSRSELLKDDLRHMELEIPSARQDVFPERDGTALGVLYVLEGSRLGGRVLSARVAQGLPRAYLSAFHQKGEWPEFLAHLERSLNESDAARRQAVTAGAIMTFDLFRTSTGSQD